MSNLKHITISVLLVVSLALTGRSFDVSARPLQAIDPALGAATTFSALAALSATSANTTTIAGDLGLSPGIASSISGPWVVGGSTYAGPLTLAALAQTDALGAFNEMGGQASVGVWNGATNLTPGVWSEASDAAFTGTLTLTGDYADVWIFQIGRDMTFSGTIVMAGNAQPCHVYWQIGRSATIASGSTFAGTLIASADITLVSGANVSGRVISLNSNLTTDNNVISNPSCQQAPGETLTPTESADATSTPESQERARAKPTKSAQVSGLPNTGGAPIREQELPWTLVIISASLIVIGLSVRTYRRVRLPKQ